MATTKNYYITYWSEKSIVNPGDSETYYKVKAIKESKSPGSGISLSVDQYNRWVNGLTPYHYINDDHFEIEVAFVDMEQKIADEAAALEAYKGSEVSNLWGFYVNADMVGAITAEDYKVAAQAKALLLDVAGQKAFIVEQMRYLSGKISALEDLSQDVTELQNEYSNLILEYETLETT